jgi:hypothetical protein
MSTCIIGITRAEYSACAPGHIVGGGVSFLALLPVLVGWVVGMDGWMDGEMDQWVVLFNERNGISRSCVFSSVLLHVSCMCNNHFVVKVDAMHTWDDLWQLLLYRSKTGLAFDNDSGRSRAEDG